MYHYCDKEPLICPYYTYNRSSYFYISHHGSQKHIYDYKWAKVDIELFQSIKSNIETNNTELKKNGTHKSGVNASRENKLQIIFGICDEFSFRLI